MGMHATSLIVSLLPTVLQSFCIFGAFLLIGVRMEHLSQEGACLSTVLVSTIFRDEAGKRQVHEICNWILGSMHFGVPSIR